MTMKQTKVKKTAHMTIRMEPPLRKRIEDLAKKERRTNSDQVAYLVEKGLSVLEAGPEVDRK